MIIYVVKEKYDGREKAGFLNREAAERFIERGTPFYNKYDLYIDELEVIEEGETI